VIGLWLFIKGLIAGIAIAAPVGPINVLTASRTLSKGRASGLLSGLGAATADAFYGAIAAFSITLVIDFLLREQFWIRVVGGILLVTIGVIYFRKPPQPLKQEEGEPAHSDYVSTFLLTLTNPTTVLSFLAVLTALGMDEKRPWWLSFLVVGGIFAGSTLWWIILVLIVNKLRDRFTERTVCWMNRIAGLAIGGFGIVTFTVGITSSK
jgi:threonine/homoserine/homoserine lactone efflux protein